MPQRSGFCALITVFLLFAAAAFPADDSAPAQPPAGGEIVIGATFPLTGPLETYGQSAYYGAATSVKLISEGGGVNGKKLVLQWRDNASSAEQAARDIEELVREYHVPAILGPLMTEGVMAARPVAEKLGVVVLTPLTTTNAATRDNPWMFRANFTNTAEAKGIITFQMNSFGARTCGILYDPDKLFSTELTEIFAKEFTERGGVVVGSRPFRINGETDYATPLKELAAHNPDFIFAPSYALEATEIIHTARYAGITTRFCGPDTWDNELVYDAAGSRLAGTCTASALFEQEFSYRPFQIFFNAMEQAGMDTPDAQAACAYDAVRMLAEALQTGETPMLVRKGLLHIRRLPLATGRTTMSPEGDAVKPVIIRVVERRGGRLEPIYAERYDP